MEQCCKKSKKEGNNEDEWSRKEEEEVKEKTIAKKAQKGRKTREMEGQKSAQSHQITRNEAEKLESGEKYKSRIENRVSASHKFLSTEQNQHFYFDAKKGKKPRERQREAFMRGAKIRTTNRASEPHQMLRAQQNSTHALWSSFDPDKSWKI